MKPLRPRSGAASYPDRGAKERNNKSEGTTMKMNHHYGELKASYLFVDIAHKVAAYQEAHPEKEIIRMGIGDVTQPLAKCVVEAMHKAADEMGTKEGFHGYGPEQGYPFLKQAIQGYYASRGTKIEEDEIFISDGAKSDLANILGLFDVDNTVLVPDPVYPTYVDDNVTDGRKIIYSRTSEENGFLGMPDENVKADIIYICSPNNPTGAAYTREQLKEWVAYAKKNNAIILYDAAYECFISDGALARSIFEIEGARECAIEICSFSKIAGFTGTRCGYTVVPKELEREGMNINKLWLRRQTTKFNGVPYLVQRAAAAVFTESGMAEIQANLDYYRRNAKVLADALDECGVWYCGGKNSPYIWLRCPGNMKSWEFFDWLLNTCAGYCLIGGINHTFDFIFIIQRLQRNHCLNGGAVGVGNDVFVPADILRVYLGNNQGNRGIHSPLGAVVDDDAAMSGCDGCEFFACAAACGEQCDINGLIKGMLIQLFHNIVLAIEFQRGACGTGRCHNIEVFDGQLSFLQNLQESSAYHACCADYGEIDFLHFKILLSFALMFSMIKGRWAVLWNSL